MEVLSGCANLMDTGMGKNHYSKEVEHLHLLKYCLSAISYNSVDRKQRVQGWTIGIITVGMAALLIGSSVCSVLGVMVTLTTNTKLGKHNIIATYSCSIYGEVRRRQNQYLVPLYPSGSAIGGLMLVVSILTFPVSLFSYCVMKNREWNTNEGWPE